MQLSEFDYRLPEDRIAKRPAERRGDSRMLLVCRSGGEDKDSVRDCHFRDLPGLLKGGELVLVNNARVLPARLFGRRQGVHAESTGARRREFLQGQIEVLLTREIQGGEWEALVRPGRKMRVGERVVFGGGELEAEVTGRGEYGLRCLRFSMPGEVAGGVNSVIERLGHMPLPPYIDRPDDAADRERYQTIFASRPGAVAAPTAGLHFTPEVLEQIAARKAEVCEITLRVGLGTFQPIRTERVEDHRMHREAYEIPESTRIRVTEARKERRPILAVGTTVVRALEDAARKGILDREADLSRSTQSAEADLFIYPGFEFRVVNQMLTNFHLPKSSLLLMVAAFAGRERILRAYEHAIRAGYRFYSYGDCMLIR